MSATIPASDRRRAHSRDFVFWLKFVGLLALVMLAIGVSVGVGQSPAPKPSDDKLQLRVLSALDNDPVLKKLKLSLLVNIVDGQAIVSGPIPDDAVSERIHTVAKAVPGVAAVKLSVWVPTPLVPEDPLGRKVAELMKAEPPKASPSHPAPQPVLSVPPAIVPPPTGKEAASKPAPVLPKPVARPADPRPSAAPTSGGPKTSHKGPDGLLLDPVVPTGTGFRPAPLAPGAAPLPYETIPPPNVPPLPPEPAAPPPRGYLPVDPRPEAPAKEPNGLDTLRKNPRFAGLKVDVVDDVAVVSGRGERVWELAQAVRKLPGVSRVRVRAE